MIRYAIFQVNQFATILYYEVAVIMHARRRKRPPVKGCVCAVWGGTSSLLCTETSPSPVPHPAGFSAAISTLPQQGATPELLPCRFALFYPLANGDVPRSSAQVRAPNERRERKSKKQAGQQASKQASKARETDIPVRMDSQTLTVPVIQPSSNRYSQLAKM